MSDILTDDDVADLEHFISDGDENGLFEHLDCQRVGALLDAWKDRAVERAATAETLGTAEKDRAELRAEVAHWKQDAADLTKLIGDLRRVADAPDGMPAADFVALVARLAVCGRLDWSPTTKERLRTVRVALGHFVSDYETPPGSRLPDANSEVAKAKRMIAILDGFPIDTSPDGYWKAPDGWTNLDRCGLCGRRMMLSGYSVVDREEDACPGCRRIYLAPGDRLMRQSDVTAALRELLPKALADARPDTIEALGLVICTRCGQRSTIAGSLCAECALKLVPPHVVADARAGRISAVVVAVGVGATPESIAAAARAEVRQTLGESISFEPGTTGAAIAAMIVEHAEAARAAVDKIRDRRLVVEKSCPDPQQPFVVKQTSASYDACSRCGDRLFFSARQRGSGLCGPCQRIADGSPTASDREHDERYGLIIAAKNAHRIASVGDPMIAADPDHAIRAMTELSEEWRRRWLGWNSWGEKRSPPPAGPMRTGAEEDEMTRRRIDKMLAGPERHTIAPTATGGTWRPSLDGMAWVPDPVVVDARQVSPPPPTPDDEQDEDALDGRDFYELMQAYRTAPLAPQSGVVHAFEEVKAYVRDLAESLRRASSRQRLALLATMRLLIDMLSAIPEAIAAKNVAEHALEDDRGIGEEEADAEGDDRYDGLDVELWEDALRSIRNYADENDVSDASIAVERMSLIARTALAALKAD